MSTAREVRTGARGPDRVRRLGRRAGIGALTAVMATGAALPLVATPASASLTGPGVDPGQNITVFHNIDMVAIFGYEPVGSVATVEVWRNGVKIGTASGPTVATDEGAALEVNHGVDGAAQAGDCWIGAAPDIKAGDKIVVRHEGDEDEVTVDDIHYTSRAIDAGDAVLVEGVAVRADGTAIPADALDSAEFRSDSGKYRTAPVVLPRSGELGGFTLRYSAPYLSADGRNRDNLSEAQRKAALLSQDGHAIGFGHADPLPLESMLVDGLADVPGHAPGCGGTPVQPLPPEPFEPDTPPGSPSVNPRTGTYSSAQSVTMSAELGAVIRYTVGQGTSVPADPTTTSTRYTGPITVSTSQIIKAVAYDGEGNRSDVTRRDYTISSGTVTTRTLTLRATADTMARQSSPTTTYGKATTLKTDTQAISGRASRETAYVKFAIPALAAGETITGAKLGLNVTNATDNGPTVWRTGTVWDELKVTWNNKPSRLTNVASSGSFGRLDLGKRTTSLSLGGIAPSRTLSFQLHADSNNDLAFTSRESSTTGNRPYLVLTIRKG